MIGKWLVFEATQHGPEDPNPGKVFPNNSCPLLASDIADAIDCARARYAGGDGELYFVLRVNYHNAASAEYAIGELCVGRAVGWYRYVNLADQVEAYVSGLLRDGLLGRSAPLEE